MSCCDGCSRRSERCHADCADYLAERILAAHDGRDRIERVLTDYEIRSIERGGRRKSGIKVYKTCRSPGWKHRGTGIGK